MRDLLAFAAPVTPPKPRTPHAAAARCDPFPDHACAVCGVDCGFGFGVFLRQGKPGRWSCLAHRDDVERMVG